MTEEIFEKKNIEIVNKKRKPKPSIVYDTYWQFAAKRQEIFFKRLQGEYAPWTSDPIMQLFKFTNAYRATDRVSQYLIREVIYKGDQRPDEVFFRTILFKLFNKIETWQLLTKYFGEVRYSDYSFNSFDKVLTEAKKKGISIYSSAYIMASGREAFGFDMKHRNHLKLVESMLVNNLPEKVQICENMETLYMILKSYPTIGSFLAYQLATDINYSMLTSFSEMEFVKAGPGAQDGIRKCFSDMGDYSEEDIIKMMCENQSSEFERLGIEFKSLWGRPLQLIDCQNVFCEVDKYSRIAHPEITGISDRKRIKQKFKQRSLTPIRYFFPLKWKLIIS